MRDRFVEALDDGKLTLKTVATIVKDSQDRHHDKCKMSAAM